MAAEFIAVKWLGWILELFNCLPISSRNPRQALLRSIHALKQGDVICIFPEGQLTRTGTLCAAKGGVKMLAKKAECPVIPIYMDELWGSIFSFSGNRFFSKKPKSVPYRMTASVGEAIDPHIASAPFVMNRLRELSCACIEISATMGRDAILARLEKIGRKPIIFCDGESMTGSDIAQCLINDSIRSKSEILRAWEQQLLNITSDPGKLRNLWINTQQIARVNALQPGEMMVTTVGNNEPQEAVSSILWPILTATPVYLVAPGENEVPALTKQFAGGAVLRKQMYSIVPSQRSVFYDFSSDLDLALPNIGWRPCFILDNGIVIAMSMMRSVFRMDDGTIQLGMRPKTRGLILPGFYLLEKDNRVLNGPCLSEDLTLPADLYLDEAGFLAELDD